MRSVFARFLANHYPSIRTQNPLEGRRAWLLRAMDLFWASNPPKPGASADAETQDDISADDDDPMDQVIDDVGGGIVLRTDFSNEEAWQIFLGRLKTAEIEHQEANGQPEETEAAATSSGQVDEDDSDTEDGPGQLIKIVDASLPEERALFDGISNLKALRLFCDVDLRPAPALPEGEKRVSVQNRLVDRGGWQEVYSGITIWIYDARSNDDQCVRLVNSEGDVYGTATADSWRAQVTHVYDLQFNMTFLGMKINFGGMDRWDVTERLRNLEEAEK